MLHLPTVQSSVLRNALGLGFALLCAGALAASGQWWWLQAYALPPDMLLIAMGTVTVASLFANRDRSGLPFPAAGTLLMAGMYFSYYTVPLGDFWAAAVENELRLGILYQSSLLGTLILYVADIVRMPLGWLAPMFGSMTTFLALFCLQQLTRTHEEHKHLLPLATLVFFGSGIPLLFFRGYVEMTFLGLPWFLLFLLSSQRYFMSKSGLLWAAGAAVTLVLAGLTHGQFTFLLPLLPLLPWLKRGRVEWNASVWKEWLIIGACAAGTAALVIGGLLLAEFHLYTGDINGGGDGERFVPLWEVTGRARFTMFSWDHVWQTLNILLLVSPLTFFAPWLVLHATNNRAHAAFTRLLAFGTLGYLAFMWLWNFDLGFPTDYDLMVSMGLTFVLWLVCLTMERYERLPKPWVWTMVIGALVLNWSFIALFLKR